MNSIKKFVSILLAATMVLAISATNISAEEYYVEEEVAAEDEGDVDWGFDYVEPEYFSEELTPTFTAKPVANGVLLSCDYVYDADLIRIYRYDAEKKKYVFLADSHSTHYCDTTAQSLASYSYKIRMYSGAKKSKLSKAVKIKTPLLSGAANVAVSSSTIKIFWNKNSKADGYEIYYYKAAAGSKKNFYTASSSTGTFAYNEKFGNLEKIAKKEFKKLKTTEKTSYSIKRDKKYNYYFKIRAYTIKNGKKTYSDFSDIIASTSSASLFNGGKGKTKSMVPVISYRSDVNGWTMSISDDDKKIMDAFMKEHFTSNMSDYDKAVYLADYIHYNVNYADTNGLSKISNMSCIQAAITNKTGQCYHYNGALAEFLAYMGYDVRLACGYRESMMTGDKISHYWCEITLDGTKYVLDAGNKKDGLYNFCLPYECVNGYLLNQ